jgi:hypothetical protein
MGDNMADFQGFREGCPASAVALGAYGGWMGDLVDEDGRSLGVAESGLVTPAAVRAEMLDHWGCPTRYGVNYALTEAGLDLPSAQPLDEADLDAMNAACHDCRHSEECAAIAALLERRGHLPSNPSS